MDVNRGGEARCEARRGDRETAGGTTGRTDGIGGGASTDTVVEEVRGTAVPAIAGDRARPESRAGACQSNKVSFSSERAQLCHAGLTGVSDTAAAALAGATRRGFAGDGPVLVDAARLGADAVCRTARAARGALPVRDSTPGAAARDSVLLSDGLAEAPLAVGRSTATRGRLAVKVVVGWGAAGPPPKGLLGIVADLTALELDARGARVVVPLRSSRDDTGTSRRRSADLPAVDGARAGAARSPRFRTGRVCSTLELDEVEAERFAVRRAPVSGRAPSETAMDAGTRCDG